LALQVQYEKQNGAQDYASTTITNNPL